MKVIFLGTPVFALNCLKEIRNSAHTVAAVVTQPDKVNARGNKIVVGPVKAYALENGIPVFQFNNISKEGEDVLRSFNADIMVTAAYGQILKQNILGLCPEGVINVHASLLPAYRGASPVQRALINGEKEIGVSIMKTELGVDTGAVCLTDSIPTCGLENSDDALEKLSFIGGKLLVRALDEIEKKEAHFIPQDEKYASYSGMFKKEDGKIDFSKTSEEVYNFVRGINPSPGAFTHSENGVLKILKVEPCQGEGKVGEILVADPKKGLEVACGEGSVRILRLKPENGKEMDAKAYLAGKKLTVGSVLGE